MGVSVSHAAASESVDTGQVASARLPRWFRDVHGGIAAALYLLVILWYDHATLAHLGSVCACSNMDPTQWMWSWKWIPYALIHGHNPLLTSEIWPGQRFDLAAITLAPILAIPGAPLTALFGPIAAYNVLTFAAPVLSGWAAYRLCRYLSGATWASILAGYLYGFSAFELGHLLGHLNLVFVFVPPLLILVVLRHLNGEISRCRATVFAAVLILIQLGLSTEILLDSSYLGALALIGGFILAPEYRPRIVQTAILLAVAYLAVAVIGSYYIYQALSGPAESKHVGIGDPTDLLSYIFPTPVFKLGGLRFAGLSGGFSPNDPYEQNAYLGLPLIAIVLAFTITTWRRRVTKLVAVITAVAFVLSLGVKLTISGQAILWMPFNVLEHLPVFDLSIPSRLGLFVALGAALATALWLSWAVGRRSTAWRWLVALAAVAIVWPNVAYPSPPAAASQPPYFFANTDLRPPGRINAYAQPTFFTTGLYKRYLRRNEIVLAFPFSQFGDDMLWQAETDMYFRLLDGYLGAPPPSYAANPLVNLLYGTGELPGASQAGQLRSLLVGHHVGAVIIQDGQGGGLPSVLAGIGWRQRVAAGGVELFAPGPAAA